MRKPTRDIRLVIFEAVVTAGIVSFPIMPLFYTSLTLTQEQIALTQVAYTAIVMILNIPCGWLADRFGRKEANILGDAVCALSLLCYSMTQSFWGIVACECLFGAGAAMSQGVDSSLLKHFCEKSAQPFRDHYAKMTSLAMLCSLIWFFSPLLASFGWSVSAITIAVAINELCKVLGAKIAQTHAKYLKDWQIFFIPIATVSIGCIILIVYLTPVTITFYACFGIACGWVSATMMPMLKEEVRASEQSTIESAARVISSLLYIVSVWPINRAAGLDYRLGFAVVLIIFLPLSASLLPKMIKEGAA